MNENNEKTNNKKTSKALSAIIIALIFVLAFIGGYFTNHIFVSRETRVLNEIVTILKEVGYVVDPKTGEFIELNEKELSTALVNEFLDVYSAYYTPNEYEQIKAQNRGESKGVGLTFESESPIIVKVRGNSPAEKAGFRKNDKILSGRENNGESIDFKTTQQVITFMTECADDAIMNFVVERDGTQVNIATTKREYITSYVNYYDSGARYHFVSDVPNGKPEGKLDEGQGLSMLDDDTAYVIFDGFEGDALNQMDKALNIMGERGRSKLVLDITANGGGQMDILCGIAGFLIENEGSGNFVVAYSSGKTGTEEHRSGRYNFKSHIKEIVVIASENSASASECLIGALSCYGGAFTIDKLVVEKNEQGVAKTYGKGIMQTTYLLPSGGAFKLTTARVLWPDGNTCIHGTGVVATGENAVEEGEGLARAVAILR